MSNLAGVVRLLKKEQDRLTKELRGIGAALAAFGKTYGKGTGTRKLSASARAADRGRYKNQIQPKLINVALASTYVRTHRNTIVPPAPQKHYGSG